MSPTAVASPPIAPVDEVVDLAAVERTVATWCDGLDASLVPALGTPEPGGLGWYDTLSLITALADGPGILGMDISEIAPIEGFVAPQFCIARLIYRILGRVKAGRRVH